MKASEARKLRNGVYYIYWKKGSYSVGSIGRDSKGAAWFAPANWIGFKQNKNGVPCQDWRGVEWVELIEESPY